MSGLCVDGLPSPAAGIQISGDHYDMRIMVSLDPNGCMTPEAAAFLGQFTGDRIPAHFCIEVQGSAKMFPRAYGPDRSAILLEPNLPATMAVDNLLSPIDHALVNASFLPPQIRNFTGIIISFPLPAE